MNKDYTQEKLLSFEAHKQIKILYDLARFIEKDQGQIESNHFSKLQKYHDYLSGSPIENIQKLNKEFAKIKALDYQFQIYLMLLERLLGQTTKEYEFLVQTKDSNTPIKKFPIVCVLDSVRSAHNVGAMLRNAECFGVEKVYLCGLTPKLDNASVLKTAMGSEKFLSVEYEKDALSLVHQLKDSGYLIVGIETAKKAISLPDFRPLNEKLALFFGHEHFGLSLDLLNLCDEVISIPMYGHKNSLNVSIAQGITLQYLSSFINQIHPGPD